MSPRRLERSRQIAVLAALLGGVSLVIRLIPWQYLVRAQPWECVLGALVLGALTVLVLRGASAFFDRVSAECPRCKRAAAKRRSDGFSAYYLCQHCGTRTTVPDLPD